MTDDYGPPRDAAELERFATIAEQALGFERRMKHGDWLERYQPDGFRLVRRGGAVVGGLYLIECGQFFGGRRVPMAGVNAVAIAPEARGHGVGTGLMNAAVRELHGRGVAISTLYPATQPIYRRAGYEQAGDFIRLRIPTAALPRGARTPVERLDGRDPEVQRELDGLHRRLAVSQAGSLDRTEFLWRRLIDPLAFDPVILGVREAGALTGYLSLQQTPRPPGPGLALLVLHVRALEAATPTALDRLLTALADFDSMCEVVLFDGPPRHPALVRLGEFRPSIDLLTRWMLRVTDATAALTARGYPVGMQAELVLELDDSVLAGHSGRLGLAVAGGRGVVRPGGDGPALRLGERGLAALFAGYLAAEELAGLGMAAGSADTLATASAIFAGPAPWLGEIF